MWRSDSVKAFRIRIHVLEAQRERERFIISSQFSAQLSVVGRYYMSLSYEGRVGNCAGFLLSRICKKFQSQPRALGHGILGTDAKSQITTDLNHADCHYHHANCRGAARRWRPHPQPAALRLSLPRLALALALHRHRRFRSVVRGTWYVTDGVQQVALQSFLVPFVIFARRCTGSNLLCSYLGRCVPNK